MTILRPIYILGIDTPPPPFAVEKWGTYQEIERKVKADLENLGRHGFPCTLQILNHKALEEGLAIFEKQLAAGKDGMVFTALMIGAGTRTYSDPMALQGAISIARKVLSPDVPILFNNGPSDHTATVERYFGTSMSKSS
jgi:hypothetical protein